MKAFWRLSGSFIEIPQVRRLLALARGHQEAVGAEHVIVVLDADVRVVLGADLLDPVVPRVGVAGIFLLDRPGTGQRRGGVALDIAPDRRKRRGLVVDLDRNIFGAQVVRDGGEQRAAVARASPFPETVLCCLSAAMSLQRQSSKRPVDGLER